MEMLSLFDTQVLDAPPAPLPEASGFKPSVVQVNVDMDMLTDLKKQNLSYKSAEEEIGFLKGYVERFGFERDQLRLQTLLHYCETVKPSD